MPDINLKLAIDEVNAILEGLGNLPFAKVYTLVAKIQAQAAPQVRDHAAGAEPSTAVALAEAVR